MNSRARLCNHRSNIFELFDLVMLLSGGRMVYFGKASNMVSYFTRLNYPCPELTNPCDYYGKLLPVLFFVFFAFLFCSLFVLFCVLFCIFVLFWFVLFRFIEFFVMFCLGWICYFLLSCFDFFAIFCGFDFGSSMIVCLFIALRKLYLKNMQFLSLPHISHNH